MAKVKSKGTVFSQEVSMVYNAVAQLTDISTSGSEVETFDCTTLDGGVGKELGQTGYSEGGEVSISGFFDPVLAAHQAITDLITTPAENNFKITFADAATTDWIFAGAGISIETTVAMADGVKFSSSIPVTGLITFPT